MANKKRGPGPSHVLLTPDHAGNVVVERHPSKLFQVQDNSRIDCSHVPIVTPGVRLSHQAATLESWIIRLGAGQFPTETIRAQARDARPGWRWP